MVAGPVQESNFFPLEVYMYTRVQAKAPPPPVAWSLEQWFMVLGPGIRVNGSLYKRGGGFDGYPVWE
jgi:hypothetical protein